MRRAPHPNGHADVGATVEARAAHPAAPPAPPALPITPVVPRSAAAPLDALVQDPALPHLGLLLDPVRMRERFASRLRSPDHGSWTLTSCDVEDATHRPGRHCAVLYRLGFQSPDGARSDEWVYAKAFAPELARPRYEKALGLGAGAPLRPFLAHVPPVGFWNDLNLTLTLFPHDPKMPSLRRALDPRRVRWEIEAHAALVCPDLDAALASSGLLECAHLDLRRVKYMPGKRCVVRWQATLEHAPGGPRNVGIFAKTYAIGRGASRFQTHRDVAEQLRAQGSPVDLPRPLLYLDDLDTAWLTDWGGRPLLESIGAGEWTARVERAARLLAAFHRSRLEGLPAARTPGELLENAIEDGERLSRTMPAMASVVARMRDRLEAKRDRVAPAGARTPVHGACRAEQMLFRGDEVTLVDFDGLASGDPLADVAEWIVSLEFLSIREGRAAAELEASGRTFLAAYEDAVPGSCDRGRIAWYALASLLTKMSSVVKHLDAPAIQRMLARGETLAARWMEAV